jgi:hypothetical protein
MRLHGTTRRTFIVMAAAIPVALISLNARAKDFHIVALGASNTYGKGMGRHSGGG